MNLDICRDCHSFSHGIDPVDSPKEHIKAVFLSGVLNGLTNSLRLESEDAWSQASLWATVEEAGARVDLCGGVDNWVEFVRLAYSWFCWFR